MPIIYCIEDDDGIRELVSCALKSGGYEVKSFADAKTFYGELETERPALVLLDVMLPDEDGLSILKRLKLSSRFKDLPVIMLTAKTSEIDKVSGLEAGADDYITKPFGVMELLSRIKAVLRRTNNQDFESEIIIVDELKLDSARRIVQYKDKEISLTYKEFELLMYLMKHKSVAVDRDKIMSKVWGYDFGGETRTVDMHIKTLRQKLEGAGCYNMIKTVRGIGYKI